MTQPHYIDREAVALAPCPFCSHALVTRGGLNDSGRCATLGCYMNSRGLVVPLDEPRQVAEWNRRPAMEAVAWREKIVAIINREIRRDCYGEQHGEEEAADAILALLAAKGEGQ